MQMLAHYIYLIGVSRRNQPCPEHRLIYLKGNSLFFGNKFFDFTNVHLLRVHVYSCIQKLLISDLLEKVAVADGDPFRSES